MIGDIGVVSRHRYPAPPRHFVEAGLGGGRRVGNVDDAQARIGDVGVVPYHRHACHTIGQYLCPAYHREVGRVRHIQHHQPRPHPDVGVVTLHCYGEGAAANLAYELHVFGVGKCHALPGRGRHEHAA